MKPALPIFTVGRAAHNHYRIVDDSISETHLQITPLTPLSGREELQSASEYLLRCVNDQADGLIVDRQPVKVAKVEKYTPLQLGRVRTTLGDILKNVDGLLSPTANPLAAQVREYHLKLGNTYLAGASSVCDISLPAPRIAWHAFKLQPHQHEWQIETVHKTSGKPSLMTLRSGEILKISPYHLLFGAHGHLQVQIAKADHLVIRNLDIHHPTSRYQFLIHSLSLAVQAGEFMGIIGPSGAGKSTLLKAIRQLIPIHQGTISLSGQDTRSHPDILKEIGFIPQDDVVILELTVEENLQYAASFKLPADWPAAARQEKVNELLNKLRLQERRQELCSKISGGQRKRVNLALELLLEPTFLLADEVCSGLSALDTDNILQHLRRIADSGKGVILTIHSPDIEALDLMDTLLVLDVGGLIAYYGPAREALPYFSSAQGGSPYKSPKLIFDVLEKKTTPEGDIRVTSSEAWQENYRNSTYHHHYIENRLAKGGPHGPN
jgi:ABC-type multidrug transport system ATPase subunit